MPAVAYLQGLKDDSSFRRICSKAVQILSVYADPMGVQVDHQLMQLTENEQQLSLASCNL